MADDDESLDDILSGTATPEITTEAAPEATPEAKPRDEHGRFAPKAEEAEEVEEQAPEEAEGHDAEHSEKKPPPGLIEERRKRQAIEQEREADRRELAELRGTVSALMQRINQPAQPQPEPAKPPDFWAEPDKYLEHALNPVQQKIAAVTFRASRAEAFAEYGKDAVAAAEAAVKQAVSQGQLNPETIREQLRSSQDPVGDIVRWHQGTPEVQKASLRDQLRAELMAQLGIDPNAPKPSPTPSRNAPLVKLPPSLSRVPAGHAAPERDESLDEVLTMRRGARA